MRIQLEIPEESAAEMKAIMKEANVRTYSELFNIALTLLQWCVKESRKGRMIASLEEGQTSYKELAMPIFAALSPRKS